MKKKMNIKIREIKIGNIVLIDSTYPEDADPRSKYYYNSHYDPEVLIKVTSKTKQGDIIKAWPKIKKALKRLPEYVGKNKEKPYLKRDKRIYELWKKRHATKEIQRIIHKEFKDNLLDSFIRQIASRMSKKYGKRPLGKNIKVIRA